ncbi:MAG: TetR/AcrR family transcriptional regulator [Actinomycetes bacterium]
MTATPERSSIRGQQRERVLLAALAEIADRGPEVRVKDIADRAGMSAGHVLYYFGSKDRILLETLRMSEDDLVTKLSHELTRLHTPWSRVKRVVERYLAVGPGDSRWNLWAQALARTPHSAEDLALLDRLERAWRPLLEQAVADGVADRTFRPVDAHLVTERTTYLMDGVCMDVLMGTPGRDRAWAVRFVLESLDAELRGG